MAQYLLVFLAGLAGSLHCVGMCGGFACALGSDPRGRAATLRRQLLYNVGRVTTYMFLGALAGTLGSALTTGSSADQPLLLAQRGLALVAGLLLVFIGLQFLGYFRSLTRTELGLPAERPARNAGVAPCRSRWSPSP